MKIKLVLFAVFATALTFSLSSYKVGPAYNAAIDGTGAEGSGSVGPNGAGTATSGCSTNNTCHNATTSLAPMIELDSMGTAVTTYHAGGSYTIKISGTNSTTHSLPKFGFQLATVKAAGAGTNAATQAGIWGASLPTNVHFVDTGTCATCSFGLPIPIVEQSASIAATSGSGGSGTTYAVSVPWTAPAAGTGAVAIYGVLNGASGNDVATENYYQVAAPITITEARSTGINSLSDKVNGFNAYPSLVNDKFTVSFDLKESSNVTLSLISVQGQEVKMLVSGESLGEGAFRRSFDVNGLASGIYLVRLQIGNASIVSKIVKD